MTLPTNEAFATEIKSDRLKILYQATSIFAIVAMILVISFGTMVALHANAALGIFGAMASLLIGSWLSHQFLEREKLELATWAYALGGVVCCGTLMYFGDDLALQLVPFVFPVIVFIIGLLISPESTFILAGIATAVTIFVPPLGHGGQFSIEAHQLFAMGLMLLAALLASQVTGELYQVTRWALENYQRERRTNHELFEKRQQLQLSLKRSEILSQELQYSNEELKIAHQEAEEARDFRGQFLANMSHELRTPLNAIIGFSETMLEFPIMYDNVPLPDAYERDMKQIYNSGRQLLHVINDIIDLAKVDAGKLDVHIERIEPEPIIMATMSTAKGLLGSKPVELLQDLPEAIPTVMADESRFRQVLLNLYSNACKYTDEGYIKITVHQDDDEVIFSVADTGTGIDEEFHDKLFEEFQQARHKGRDPRAGSGLGLAISRQLLDLMDGRIWMTSTPGEGSTFSFAVKAATDQPDSIDVGQIKQEEASDTEPIQTVDDTPTGSHTPA